MPSPKQILTRFNEVRRENGIRYTLLVGLKRLTGVNMRGNLGNRQAPESEVEMKGIRPAIINPLNYKSFNSLDYEWTYGYPWYLKRIEGQHVLDVGSLGHLDFTRSLLAYGFKVTGMDVQDCDFKCDNFYFYHQSILVNPFTNNNFDTVIYNSLLEHLGLDHYEGVKSPDNSHEQMKAMDEAYRILKPSGCILLQVPYSSNLVTVSLNGRKFYQTINSDRLAWLLSKFEVIESTYVILEKSGWVEVSKAVADKVVAGGSLPSCLVFVKARKI